MSLWENLCIHKERFQETTEHVSMMSHTCWSKKKKKKEKKRKEKKEKKRKEENTFFSYLPHLKSEKLYIFIIILIMVAEIYNLSKNSSLSEYAIVYSKRSKVWQFFFVDNVFIGSTFPLPDHKESLILKSSLLIKYLTRDPKHNFILG